MPKALSIDLRERIVRAWKDGKEWEEIAQVLMVGVASVNRVVCRYRRTGLVTPKPHGGGQPPKIPDDKLPVVAALVDAEPDATLLEYAAAYQQREGVSVSTATIGRALARLNLSRKKRRSARAKRAVRR